MARSHLVGVLDNAKNLGATACTRCVQQLIRMESAKPGDDIQLRSLLRTLLLEIRELVGALNICRVTAESFDAVKNDVPGHVRWLWVSDMYYVHQCRNLFEGICDALPPGETTPKMTTGVALARQMEVAQLKGRLREGARALDPYSFHRAISRFDSIQYIGCACSVPGLGSPDHPNGPVNVSQTQRWLQLLNQVGEDRLPSVLSVEKQLVEARNKTDPDYATAALRLPHRIVNEAWDLLQHDALQLFGKRTNFMQFLLEYCRQIWPAQYGFDAVTTRPTITLIELSATFPGSIFSCTIAASFGLYRVCISLLGTNETAYLSIVLYSAVLGPTTMLSSWGGTLWERIHEAPHSVNQIETITLLLEKVTVFSNEWLWKTIPPPAPPDYLSFLVCLRLRDSQVCLQLLRRCGSLSDEFLDFLRPGPFWQEGYQFEPCASSEARQFLEDTLEGLADSRFPTLDDDASSHGEFHTIYTLMQYLDLQHSRVDYQWKLSSVADEDFAETVRSFIRDADTTVSVMRRLTQDPRWDPNLPYEDPASRTMDALGQTETGGTILHLAVEACNNLDGNTELLQCILATRPDLSATDGMGRTALSVAERQEVFRLLREHGADTTHQDKLGRNCWHYPAYNGDFEGIQWLALEDPQKVSNLKALAMCSDDRLEDGLLYTPLGMALCLVRNLHKRSCSGLRMRDARYASTKFLCGLVLSLDAEDKSIYLQAPHPPLHCAAEWGQEPLVLDLLELGQDPLLLDENGGSALHALNFGATLPAVQTLLDCCGDAPLQRKSDGLTPAETIFLNFKIPSNCSHATADEGCHPSVASLDRDVYMALLTPDTLASKEEDGRVIWHRFCVSVVHGWASRSGKTLVVSMAAALLAEKGAIRTFEKEEVTAPKRTEPVNNTYSSRHDLPGSRDKDGVKKEKELESGVAFFIDSLVGWTVSMMSGPFAEAFKTILSNASIEAFCRSPTARKLLERAVSSNSMDLMGILLDAGVPLRATEKQQNLNGTAAEPKVKEERAVFEVACLPNRVTAATFEKLLEKVTEPKELDRMRDPPGIGLIHLLINQNVFQRDAKLKALLAKGANPNLSRWKKSPALVSYILERQIDAAMILLENGADPNLTTTDGIDASLAAASRGSVRVLEKIKSVVPPDFNWARTCKSHFTLLHPGGVQVTTAASNCNALHLAAFNSHDMVLQFYLQHFPQVSVNAEVHEDLRRPIHFAAVGGSSACIQVLLEHGADIKAKTRDGSSPLHVAVRGSQVQAVKTLLQLGPVNPLDNENLTPFFHALLSGTKDITKQFVSREIFKPPHKASEQRARFIGQAVEAVISSGDFNRCRNLLAITSVSEWNEAPFKCLGCTPLALAIRKGRQHIVRWLLEIGCTGFIGSCSTHYGRSRRGFNALNEICENPVLTGCIEAALSAYLKAGIPWMGMAVGPLHSCAYVNNSSGIFLILRHIKDSRYILAYRRKYWFGSMPPAPQAQSVSLDEKLAMLRHVLNQRLFVEDDAPADRGYVSRGTPLHVAIERGHVNSVNVLLAPFKNLKIEVDGDEAIKNITAEVDAIDDDQRTPLHIAVKTGNEECTDILLEAGAHAETHHYQNFTPIMQAVDSGNLAVTQSLVRAGADVHIRDADGMGLLNLASERTTNPALVHYLISLGLDPYGEDKAGYIAVNDLILNYSMAGFVMNSDFDFWRVKELSKGLLSLVVEINRGKVGFILRRLLKRMPEEMVKKMVNHYPSKFVSSLCNAVNRDEYGAIHTLIKHGADVNMEGSEEGTPLMTACLRGRLESVKILVSYGAWIAYTVRAEDGKTIVRNGLALSKRFLEIGKWILVRRFTDINKLDYSQNSEVEDDQQQPSRPWTGIWKATYILHGTYREAPPVREGRFTYLRRMNDLRRDLRGKVVPAKLERPVDDGFFEPGPRWDLERGAEPVPLRGREGGG